jgi:MOSC domain-containing protein YiiM
MYATTHPITRVALVRIFLGIKVMIDLHQLWSTVTDRSSTTVVLSPSGIMPISVMAYALSLDPTAKPHGTIVRLAARKFHPQNSKPSSREYTTRKDERDTLRILKEGCEGDYNHYRTVALKNTPERAVSILTCDVMESLRSMYPDYTDQIQDGDLGENILVDGVTFRFFRVGQRYCIGSSPVADPAATDNREITTQSSVILEITERVQPCASLCKLSYINDDSMSPKERIQRCQDFILHLVQWEGYRGWYAKVICEGVVQKGAIISEHVL